MKTPTLLVVLTLSVTMSWSQDLRLRHVRTESGAFPFLVTTLQVADNLGDPITGLDASDFTVSVDGQPVDSLSVGTLQEESAGYTIMLCLDLSGSMKGTPLEALKWGAHRFLSVMRPTDRLGIVGISDSVTVASAISDDRVMLREVIDGLSAGGSRTALYYGLTRGLNELARSRDSMKILVVISDGKNESPDNYTEDDVIALATTNGTPVFAIGFSRVERAYLRTLERIAEKTGGAFSDAPSPDLLERQYQRVYNQLNNLSVVRYLVTDIPGDGEYHTSAIRVRTPMGTGTLGAKFMSPPGVPARLKPRPGWPWWYYGIAGVVLVIAAIWGWTIHRRRSRTRRRQEAEHEEDRRRRKELEEATRRKIEEVDRRLRDVQTPSSAEAVHPRAAPPGGPSTTLIEPALQGRTVILNPSGGLAPPQMLRLEMISGPLQGKRFHVNAAGATIGKAPDNTIVLPEPTVSGHHARISHRNGKYRIEDLSSTNGTFVNGRRITAQELGHSDSFRIGRCEGILTLF